jgi:hypothetical protein
MSAKRLFGGGVLALALAASAGSQEAGGSGVASGGTSEGWLQVAGERTALRHAYVFGESGDGASGELVVIVSDREMPAQGLDSAAERDDLASADEVRSLVARLPGGGGDIEVFFHHPRLPAGVSLLGLARFARESESPTSLEGRLIYTGEGSNFEVWVSAPIVRREPSDDLPEDVAPAKSFEELLREGSELEVEAALAAGPDLERVGSSGMSALAIAADAGNLGAVRKLLEAGAPPDYRADRSVMSPLMHAAGRASLDLVEALLAAGASPKLRTSSGFTPLLHAVHEGKIENARRLLAAGAELERDRESLLRIAREKGNAEMIALLEASSAPAPAPAAAAPAP